MLRVGALLGVMGMATLVLADPPAPTPTSDLDRLQGYWKPLQCEYEGKAQMPTDIMKQVTVVFDKNEYHLYFKDKEPDAKGNPIILRLALAHVALDSATNTITFEFADGPLKGKKSHGIYELAGNQLKMCYGPVDKPKPTKFESPAGSGFFLETWARQK
jgi:uncharacterized protein (TIGR03067 family)